MFLDDTLLDALLRGFLLSMIALLWVFLLIRMNGLRSLSKMTNFDFIMTVALGSLVATGATVSEWPAFWQTLTAMVGLFILQRVAARLRKTSDTAEDVMQNEPVLLMRNGKINYQALKETRVAESDLRAKLREANVLDYGKVRAVVLETTGDVSVLHGDTLDDGLLDGVDCHE